MNITKNITWNFPILTKLKNYYFKNGALKTLGWIVFIVIGTKVVIINGGIWVINYLFGTDIPYGPILYYLLGVEIESVVAILGTRNY